MIKNDRQYQATLSQIEVLRDGLSTAHRNPAPDVFETAHIQSLETDIAALEDEALAFKALRETPFELSALEVELKALELVAKLGDDLVRARISHNVTQKMLADASGKQEQAIQRWEANSYDGASVQTLRDIGHALLGLARSASHGHQQAGSHRT
jgi:HTH-type transcriptional regulator / antitoxin HigA